MKLSTFLTRSTSLSGTASFAEFERENIRLESLACSIQRINPNHATTYDIGFVEIVDAEATTAPGQERVVLSYLDEQLSKGEPIWVYVFVHGWRHNASILDSDVAKFHSILALSKGHLNQKPSLRDTKVFGIYVGWRGQSISEPAGDLGEPSIGTVLSFPGRKSQSDANAQPLRNFLEMLGERLGRKKEGNAKLVTVGHSLGGNMLLRAVSPLVTAELESSNRGKPVRGFGDLVVLLNPASELSNWEVLQRASRRHAGITLPDKNSFLDTDDCEFFSRQEYLNGKDTCKRASTHNVYPRGQLPVVLSFTASQHFEKLESLVDKAPADKATGTYFPISQRLTNPFASQSAKVALGQYLPRRAWTELGTPDRFAPSNHLYGLSHEIDTNGSLGLRTSYSRAIHEPLSCTGSRDQLVDEFEKKIEETARTDKREGGRGWNHESLVIGGEGNKKLIINPKHNVFRAHCSSNTSDRSKPYCDELVGKNQVPRLGHAREPYWNIAANPNFLVDHGGYVSHTLWCYINSHLMPSQ